MALSMAIYVAEKSFQQLTKNLNHTKAMLSSWTTSINENKNSSQFFNPMVPQQLNHRSQLNPNSASREDYEKYKWLFF
jgi:hypothetical protein